MFVPMKEQIENKLTKTNNIFIIHYYPENSETGELKKERDIRYVIKANIKSLRWSQKSQSYYLCAKTVNRENDYRNFTVDQISSFLPLD